MSNYSIALGLPLFDENSTWQANYLNRGTIMSIPSKYWIVLAIYLIDLWCMTLFHHNGYVKIVMIT